MNIQHSSRSDEWFTPQHVVEMARAVMGGIDLDPASCHVANATVRATDYYDRRDNGLTRPWHGRVFCNPPGGKTGNKSNTVLWWRKLMDELEAGRVVQAVFLAFSLEALQTTQQCGRHMLSFLLCVPSSRLAFVDPQGRTGKAPSHSNVIVGVGVDEQRFRDVFLRLGAIR